MPARGSLLAQLSEPTDRYTCERCEEEQLLWRGEVPDPPVCPCCAAAAEAAVPAIVGVPPRFAGALERVRAGRPAAPPNVRRWPGGATPLLLWGPTGTGKSTLAVALLQRAAAAGRRCAYVTAARLLHELGEEYSGRREGVLRRYIAAEVLVLDDLGAEPVRSDTGSALNLLVDERWARERTTVYVSNLPLVRPRRAGKALDLPSLEDYDPRLVSRITSGVVVHLGGRDHRHHQRSLPEDTPS